MVYSSFRSNPYIVARKDTLSSLYKPYMYIDPWPNPKAIPSWVSHKRAVEELAAVAQLPMCWHVVFREHHCGTLKLEKKSSLKLLSLYLLKALVWCTWIHPKTQIFIFAYILIAHNVRSELPKLPGQNEPIKTVKGLNFTCQTLFEVDFRVSISCQNWILSSVVFPFQSDYFWPNFRFSLPPFPGQADPKRIKAFLGPVSYFLKRVWCAEDSASIARKYFYLTKFWVVL